MKSFAAPFAFLLVFFAGLSGVQVVAAQDASPTPLPDAVIDVADAEQLVLANVYERSAPAVVHVRALTDVVENEARRGSGFVWDASGHLITNAHVVADAQEILVTFDDGFVTSAALVAQDIFSDLAVLQVQVAAERLLPLPFGDSDVLRMGDRAIAIGNPFGLGGSMTVGIVSGLGRQLPSAQLIDSNVTGGFQNPAIIQVDTPITPGASGGPLLNSRGEVIGVSTAIITTGIDFVGVGFAVPARTVQRVIPELIANGRVNYAWVGFSTLAADDGFDVGGLAEALSLPVQRGILISSVTPDSPAAKAALQGGDHVVSVRGREVCAGGDLIVAVDGNFVRGMDEFLSYLVSNKAPGDTVNLLLIRDLETLEVAVTLEARPTVGVAAPAACGA